MSESLDNLKSGDHAVTVKGISVKIDNCDENTIEGWVLIGGQKNCFRGKWSRQDGKYLNKEPCIEASSDFDLKIS